MSSLRSALTAIRRGWPGILILMASTLTIGTLFQSRFETSLQSDGDAGVLLALSWLFLGFLNLCFWLFLIEKVNGREDAAYWWARAPLKAVVAIGIAFAIRGD